MRPPLSTGCSSSVLSQSTRKVHLLCFLCLLWLRMAVGQQLRLILLGRAAIFAVEEATLPHLEIDERPEPFRVVRACLVPRHERAHTRRLENTAPQRTLTQHILFDNRRELPSEPLSNRHRKSHLLTRQDLVRQHTLHSAPQHVLRGPATSNF